MSDPWKTEVYGLQMVEESGKRDNWCGREIPEKGFWTELPKRAHAYLDGVDRLLREGLRQPGQELLGEDNLIEF